MAKKVLLICNHFAPDNTIAAVRTTKMAKYLKANGYETEIIAEKKKEELKDEILEQDAAGIQVSYAYNSKRAEKFLACYRKLIAPAKQKRFDDVDLRRRINKKTGHVEFYPFETAYPLIGSLDYIAELARQYDLFLSVKKKLKNCDNTDFIITSYGDAFSIFAGSCFYKAHRDAKWIFDIRDAVFRYKFTPPYVGWIARKLEQSVYGRADCITAISKGICRQIPRKYWYKVHCLTNGFDRSDRDGILPEQPSGDKLKFVYTGSMYGGLQDLSIFFRCMAELTDCGRIDGRKTAYYYAGNEAAYDIFRKQAEKYGQGGNCIYCGKVTRRAALKLQMESHVLLAASYDYRCGEGGVITGKALEYMSAGKPVIAVITGDIEQSELAAIIRAGKLGIACEESQGKRDYAKLKRYIEQLYDDFEKGGSLRHQPDRKVLQKYDYKNICSRLIKIMEHI